MPASAIRSAHPAGRAPFGITDAATALIASLLLVAFHAANGFASLSDSSGDNDSVLRLVQVRDLLAGQGWFDPVQYRMGLEGGFPMHWSRLVDAPVALLVALIGERAALVVWPTALFALSLFLIMRTARSLGGERAALPAAAVGGLALWFTNIFRPGAIDHHNVQLALALATLFFLVRGRENARAGALAGGAAALMLAVGMETAPYVAVACATAALAFLFGDRRDARLARGFGAAFAGTSVAVMAATIAPRDWFAVHCDAFSLVQLSLAGLGGGGLCLIASIPALGRSLGRRLAALGVLGLIAAATILLAFPQCLAAPYAELDPRLHSFLIEQITEAQSFATLLGADPAKLAVYYATPFVALAVTAWALVREGRSRERALAGAFVAAAVAVSLWQVRGSTFAIPLAAIPLAAFIAAARRRVETDPAIPAQLAMLGAWLVSVNLVWQLGATVLLPAEEAAAAADEEAAECYAHADYAALAALPAGTVAAVSNLGSSILANTPHRVLAGPYHRNQDGLLANLDIMMGEPAGAEAAARRAGVDYVVVCPDNPETGAIAQWAPDGLLARLAAGDAPDWLFPLPGPADSPLRVWRAGTDG